MGLEVYWLELAENKLEDSYGYHSVKEVTKLLRNSFMEVSIQPLTVKSNLNQTNRN